MFLRFFYLQKHRSLISVLFKQYFIVFDCENRSKLERWTWSQPDKTTFLSASVAWKQCRSWRSESGRAVSAAGPWQPVSAHRGHESLFGQHQAGRCWRQSTMTWRDLAFCRRRRQSNFRWRPPPMSYFRFRWRRNNSRTQTTDSAGSTVSAFSLLPAVEHATQTTLIIVSITKNWRESMLSLIYRPTTQCESTMK